LLVGMEGWSSKRCALTWKLKGTTYNRIYYQLEVSARPTDATGFGLWLGTPTASGNQERSEGFKRSTPTVMEYAKMLPTPLTQGLKVSDENGKTKFIDPGLLPTPTAQNANGASSVEALQNRGRLKPMADNLADQFAQSGKSSQLNPRFVAEMMGFPRNWTASPFQSGDEKA